MKTGKKVRSHDNTLTECQVIELLRAHYHDDAEAISLPRVDCLPEDTIFAYAEGAITEPAQIQVVEAHLQDCKFCDQLLSKVYAFPDFTLVRARALEEKILAATRTCCK